MGSKHELLFKTHLLDAYRFSWLACFWLSTEMATTTSVSKPIPQTAINWMLITKGPNIYEICCKAWTHINTHTHIHTHTLNTMKCLIEAYPFSTAASQLHSMQSGCCQGLCLALWEKPRTHSLACAALDNWFKSSILLFTCLNMGAHKSSSSTSRIIFVL